MFSFRFDLFYVKLYFDDQFLLKTTMPIVMRQRKLKNKHYWETSMNEAHPKSNSSTILMCYVVFEIVVVCQSSGYILQDRSQCNIVRKLNYLLRNSRNKKNTINMIKINNVAVFCIVNFMDIQFSYYEQTLLLAL